MSTNIPPRKYGYTLPSLGGKGMGTLNPATDLVWRASNGWFSAKGNFKGNFGSCEYYTRPIDVGPGNELVGEDEPFKFKDREIEGTTDGINWIPIVQIVGGVDWKVSDFIKDAQERGNTHFLAIRRRRKVVKDEWPKYWRHNNTTYKATTEECVGFLWNGSNWVLCGGSDSLVEHAMRFHFEPIAPQRAFELTGDKEILEKGGDEKCSATVANASNKCLEEQQQSQTAQSTVSHTQSSPAPEVTKGASDLFRPVHDYICIHHNDEERRTLKMKCPICAQQSPTPQWIPVSERLPKNGEHFILGYRLSENWVTSDNFYWPLDIAHSPWTHWHPLAVPPPPPQPKTREQEDEEWIKTKLSSLAPDERMIYKLAARETLAYARGEKGEK